VPQPTIDPRPSKTRVDRAGQRLVAWLTDQRTLTEDELVREIIVVRAWRAQHAYPMALAMPSLRNWVTEISTLGVPPAQRLKRLVQIVIKLHRNAGKMKLSRMQDIGGCRAVVASPAEVDALATKIRHRWKPIRESDYREHPRADTGYRALHLMVAKRDNISDADRVVEIQLRTERQHRWAEEVTTTGDRLGYDLKNGVGPADLVEYFRLASDLLWAQDTDGDLGPGFADRFTALREQVRSYFTRTP
jgi:putative GTP pyrophosphokinase